MSGPHPDPGSPLVVRYRRGFGAAALVAGVLLLVAGGVTGDPLDVVAGILVGAAGAAFLLGRALVVTGAEVQLRSPIGLTTRRFPVTGPEDLRLDGQVLRHVSGDRKIITLGRSLDPGDVEGLRAWLTPGGPA